MDNHYHLLLGTPRANLSRVMRHLNGIYTQRFNRMVKSDGPLFRGRYKAIIVEEDNYLLQVSRYIHLNPVAAGICEIPEQYMWSSYSYYIDGKNKLDWLKINKILSMISQRDGRRAYRQYVLSGVDEETALFYEKKNTPMILGDSGFKTKLLDGLTEDKIEAYKTDYKRVCVVPDVRKINQACADFFKISIAELCVGGRGVKNDFRKMGMYACRLWGAAKLSDIAEVYNGCTHGNVSNAVRDVTKRVLTDRALMLMLEDLKNSI